jgi:antirestriction protein ArdC
VFNGGDDEERTMTVEEAAERVAAAFEAGIAPWSRPHRRHLACGLPVNAATGKPIRGVDTWLLELAAIKRGYRTRYWATAEQWWESGGVVVRGEGTSILAEQGGEWTGGERVFFSVEQVEVRRGVPGDALDRFWVAPRLPDYALSGRLVKCTGARIVTGDAAYYHRVGRRDWIEMPPASVYSDADAYWCTMFHELIHWAALGLDRLGWDGDPIQGELIAELGAAILTTWCGIPMRGHLPTHGGHPLGDLVAGWVSGIRGDAAYLAEACEVAWRAAEYVRAASGGELMA